jgi:hypothetical protein
MSEVITCPCGGATLSSTLCIDEDVIGDEWFEIKHFNSKPVLCPNGTIRMECKSCGQTYEDGLDIGLCEFEEVAA